MTTVAAPMCYECTHYQKSDEGPMHCAAYPDGIPIEILLSQADHREPVKGDHGLRFDPVDPKNVGELTQNPLLLKATA